MLRLRFAAAMSAMSTVAGVAALLVVPSAAASPALPWKECAPDVTCAKLAVPLDWRHGGKIIEISLARRAATGKKIGTIVYLPGGPGDSAVEQLKQRPRVTDDVAARYDVIGLDPRGTAGSDPIRCDPALIREMTDVNPDTGVGYADVVARSRKLADSCRSRSSEVINHIDSADVARDVEALRATLGERQITLYSRSYGTLAAQMYAELFPGRVRAMVLDSVFDHSLDTREFLATLVRTTEDSFRAFAKWCATSANCVLRGQDVSALFDDLYRRAERGELAEPSDPAKKISATELSWFTMRRGFYAPSWNELAVRLAELAGQRPPTALPPPQPESDVFPNPVMCADHRFTFSSGREWTRMWDELKRMAPVMRTHLAWQIVSMCSGWPLNRMIRGSVLVTYEGAGHGVYLRNDCTKQVTDRYLIDRVLPAPGTSCPGSDPA